MFSKLDVRTIMVDHFQTLVSYDTKRTSWEDVAAFFILPLALALCLVYFDLTVGKQGVNVLFTGISIFAGLLFNLLVLTHGIVRSAVESPRYEMELQLLRETYANISYAILVAIAMLGVMLLGLAVPVGTPVKIVSGITYFLLGNFLLTLLLVLKRIHVILREEFARK